MKKTLLSLFMAAVLLSLTLLPAFTAQAAAVQESEPNNSFAEATPLAFGDTVTGNITETDDWDYYRVELDSAGKLTMTMTSYMRYYCLYLYDIDGNEVWYKDENEWNATAGYRRDTYELMLESGTYYVQANGYRWGTNYKSTGKYELTVDFLSSETTHQEPNNNFATSTALTLDQLHVGQISINDDYDNYTFTLSQAGALHLDMTSYMQYYQIKLFDIDGKEIWYTDENEWNANVGYRGDSYELVLEGGVYYLQVNGYRWGTNYKSTGRYTMTAGFTPYGVTNREPDNDFSKATEVVWNTQQVGAVTLDDDFDTYRIVMTSAGNLQMRMTSYMQYYQIKIFDIDGKEIWYTDQNEWNANVGYRKDVHTVSLDAGLYYLQVNGYRWGTSYKSTGKYELLIGDSREQGDLDGSGGVTIQDVMEACKILARQSAGTPPTSDEMARGDLDGDGKITITDVMEICKLLARKA